MARNARLSRLNIVYLATRHGGMFFLFLALGVSVGLIYQTAMLPREYGCRAERSFNLSIPITGQKDWDELSERWSGVFRDSTLRGLLTANMRYAVKTATRGTASAMEEDGADLRKALLRFSTPQTISTSPWKKSFPPYFGPEVIVSRHDLAACMDFQSLAAIVADLDPAPNAESWDFTFFQPAGKGLTVGDIISHPGPDDPYFRVFYHLHALLKPGAPASPEEVWKTAVAEVSSRLARESEYQGGGGFGERAGRELLREIRVIPVLAANGLYKSPKEAFAATAEDEATVDLWRTRWTDLTTMRINRLEPMQAKLAIRIRDFLHPFSFPADSATTRNPALAVRVAFLFIQSREDGRAAAAPSEPPPPAVVAPPPVVEEPPPALPPPARPPVLRSKPVDPRPVAEEKRRKARVAELELEAHNARVARDEAARLLNVAQKSLDPLALEEIAVKNRADRVKERLEEYRVFHETSSEEIVESDEVVELRRQRRTILHSLEQMLQTCTEEHPFVKQARRDLAAVDAALAGTASSGRETETAMRATRLRNLELEWKSAADAVAVVAEKKRRVETEISTRLQAANAADKRLADAEFALTREKGSDDSVRDDSAVRDINASIDRLADSLAAAPALVAVNVAPPPTSPAGVPPPTMESSAPGSEMTRAKVFFMSLPETIPVDATPLSPAPLYIGVAAGLLAALLWMLARELAGTRFAGVLEAKRRVDVPIIAAIPAFDGKSLDQAAKIDGGKLEVRDRRKVFIPAPVEISEPPPLERRRGVLPLRRRKKMMAWILGVLVLGLAAGLRQYTIGDLWRPGTRAYPGVETMENEP